MELLMPKFSLPWMGTFRRDLQTVSGFVLESGIASTIHLASKLSICCNSRRTELMNHLNQLIMFSDSDTNIFCDVPSRRRQLAQEIEKVVSLFWFYSRTRVEVKKGCS